ncbi:hypothetical protein Hdeb2414_s0001g00036741 [Helianthus debilis subsp. tardiflorus]
MVFMFCATKNFTQNVDFTCAISYFHSQISFPLEISYRLQILPKYSLPKYSYQSRFQFKFFLLMFTDEHILHLRI